MGVRGREDARVGRRRRKGLLSISCVLKCAVVGRPDARSEWRSSKVPRRRLTRLKAITEKEHSPRALVHRHTRMGTSVCDRNKRAETSADAVLRVAWSLAKSHQCKQQSSLKANTNNSKINKVMRGREHARVVRRWRKGLLSMVLRVEVHSAYVPPCSP